MDFTREPIIETVITPREGCKIVVRSSKASGQEEFFVDAVEVVSFGRSQFFRSLEKPKPFLVPTSDYEVLEVREARMVLKSVGIDRSIKIGGGREPPQQQQRPQKEKERDREREPRAPQQPLEEIAVSLASDSVVQGEEPSNGSEERVDPRLERRRDRRRHYRRRRGREEAGVKEELEESLAPSSMESLDETFVVSNGRTEESMTISLQPPEEGLVLKDLTPSEAQQVSTSAFSSLLVPPPNLISETIARYRENDLFKGAFYPKEPRPERRREPRMRPSLEEEEIQEQAFGPPAPENLFDDSLLPEAESSGESALVEYREEMDIGSVSLAPLPFIEEPPPVDPQPSAESEPTHP